jgi:16S rRNA (cytosine967-C5)-methyltransferase
MRAGARIAAAIEVIDAIDRQHRPAADALADWGRSHRFAGSGDRSAIGHLVYDVLRRRSSLAAQMGSEAARALVVAAAPEALGIGISEVIAAADGSEHAIPPLTEAEQAGLTRQIPADVPDWIAGDIPEWLAPSFRRVFGDRTAEEGAALAKRAAVEVRVNTLKATRDKVLKSLAKFGAEATHWSPLGIAMPPPTGAKRHPNVEAEPAHGKGWFEVQDEGSQIAALLAGAGPRLQVLDLCAGAGGKTLAFAASMHNTGQIYAYDSDRKQLRPMFERLKRAGARNVQVLDGGDEATLAELADRFDVVVVDAPCSGSGTWRRRPDSKWRLKPHSLANRIEDQKKVLGTARGLVKPGGRLVYITCSVLAEENTDQIAAFLAAAPEFTVVPYGQAWRETIGSEPPRSADGREDTLLLTPASHGTDGFFIAVLARGR